MTTQLPGSENAHVHGHAHHHHHHHGHHHEQSTAMSGQPGEDRMMHEMMMTKGQGMMMMDMSHMMMGQFFKTKTDTHVLFENVKIDSITGIAVAMVSVVLAVLVFETVNYSINIRNPSSKTRTWTLDRLLLHGLLTLMKMLSVLLGYMIMLSVMTYNVWIFASVVLGFGISHLLLRPVLQIYFPWNRNEELKVTSNDVESTRQDLLQGHSVPSDTDDNNKYVTPVRYKKMTGEVEAVTLVPQKQDI